MSECEILVMFMETILWELHVGHIKQDFENNTSMCFIVINYHFMDNVLLCFWPTVLFLQEAFLQVHLLLFFL